MKKHEVEIVSVGGDSFTFYCGSLKRCGAVSAADENAILKTLSLFGLEKSRCIGNNDRAELRYDFVKEVTEEEAEEMIAFLEKYHKDV